MISLRPRVRLGLFICAEFFIAMGTAVSGAMAQAGQIVWPVPAVYLFGFLVGFVAAWKEFKAVIQATPEPPATVK